MESEHDLSNRLRWNLMGRISELGFLITKIHHLSGRIFSRMLKKYSIEISPGQGRILFALWKEDGASINVLSERTQLGKSTLTEMLDRMEASGAITRTHSKTDRRKVIIELTEMTRSLHRKYEEVSLEMTEVYTKGLDPEELNRLERGLERILQNLIEYDG